MHRHRSCPGAGHEWWTRRLSRGHQSRIRGSRAPSHQPLLEQSSGAGS